MYDIEKPISYIPLGNQRDFGHTVQFDLTAWAGLNADDWKITYMRPGESATYPVPDGDVSVVDNVLAWTISEAVTAINGTGSVIIEAYRGGEMLKHSARIMTIIGEGHEPAGEAPDPVADWIADATSKLAEVDHFVDETIDATEAANKAAGLTNDAITRANGISATMESIAPLWADVDISVSALGEGAAPTASITQGETGTSITLGIPKGDTGDKGDKGNDGKPFTYRGDYNAGADPLYSKNDVVRFGGGSFVYINDVDSNEPTSSASHWQQIAEKGLKGDQGNQGLKGDTGNGILSVLRTSGDGTPGTTDTYTITFDDDSTTTFPVYNGADAPALSGVKQYIIRWDKVNSQCTRMGDAAAITTTITNFCHRGSVNPSYANPFDSLYPWKYRKLCKVNRVAYAALPAGSPITDAVTMWEGEPGFALDGTGDFDGVYTPEFWGRTWQDDTYVYAGVADGPIPGWIHYEATIGGRYFGALDGDGKITSIVNSFPHRNAQMSAMHTNVTAQGMTLDDIWTWSADTLLMAVEYATLNSEIAIGKGVDGLYRQSAEKVGANASVGETVLKLPNAFVATCVPGALIGLGTSDGGEQTGMTRFISSADLDGADPLFDTHKAVTVPALTVNVTTDTFVCIHGAYNAPDAAIGSMSGYIGVNGKSNAYYRGRVSHGNFFRYCLGAYRQTGTGNIWVANSRNEAAAADALNTGVHRDTGLVLPTVSNYIAELHHDNLLPMAPFAKATGGTAGSTNPVGDYCYVPSLETGNTILRLGGTANGGAHAGRFYGIWSTAASSSAWSFACLPYLKTP